MATGFLEWLTTDKGAVLTSYHLRQLTGLNVISLRLLSVQAQRVFGMGERLRDVLSIVHQKSTNDHHKVFSCIYF